MATPRTYLFVPGNRPERFAKALASGADAVVLDLEDAVAPAAKDAARDAIAQWSGRPATPDARAHRRAHQRRTTSVVRRRPARCCATARVATRDAAQGRVGGAGAGGLRPPCPAPRVLAADRERARRRERATHVAGADGVSRLVFGTLDYALDLDLDIADEPRRPGPCRQPHRASPRASRACRRRSPASRRRSTTSSACCADLAWSRAPRLRRQAVHPPAPGRADPRRAARRAPQALDWARRVLAAEAASPGAAQLDGRMVDRPVVLQAQRTLQRAGA